MDSVERISISEYVKSLADDFGITYEPVELDRFADKVTELSGDEVTQDDTLNLIVALKRNGLITSKDVADLSHKHLTEREKN